MELPPGLTMFGLLYTTVTFALLPSVYFGRLREALDRAQQRTFMQAWQLQQLAGEKPAGGATPSDPPVSAAT